MDRAVVINLDRRPERWEAFCEGLPRPWALPVPGRFSAFDGRQIAVPEWWQSGPGGYGCMLSHMTVWEEAAEEDQTLWVFEDDAIFCEDFAARLADFLAAVPSDWEMLYIGGKHCLPPTDIGNGVLRCLGVKAMHAYAVRGEPLRRLPPLLRQKPIHFDAELALLHHAMRVYAPTRWFCGQAAGVSDILNGCSERGEPVRWFHDYRENAA